MPTLRQSRQIASLNFTHRKFALTLFVAFLSIGVAEISTRPDYRAFYAVNRKFSEMVGRSVAKKVRATLASDPRPNRLRTSRPVVWKCPCSRAGVNALPLPARFLRGEGDGRGRGGSLYLRKQDNCV